MALRDWHYGVRLGTLRCIGVAKHGILLASKRVCVNHILFVLGAGVAKVMLPV